MWVEKEQKKNSEKYKIEKKIKNKISIFNEIYKKNTNSPLTN